MRKGLRMIYCSGCTKPIWRKDIEGWCFECRKFYNGLVIGIDEGIGEDICISYTFCIKQKEMEK